MRNKPILFVALMGILSLNQFGCMGGLRTGYRTSYSEITGTKCDCTISIEHSIRCPGGPEGLGCFLFEFLTIPVFPATFVVGLLGGIPGGLIANISKESEREPAPVERPAELFDEYHAEILRIEYQIKLTDAGNPDTPPDVLTILATDESKTVRQTVAKNPNTPKPLLEQLAKDSDAEVRREAIIAMFLRQLEENNIPSSILKNL